MLKRLKEVNRILHHPNDPTALWEQVCIATDSPSEPHRQARYIISIERLKITCHELEKVRTKADDFLPQFGDVLFGAQIGRRSAR